MKIEIELTDEQARAHEEMHQTDSIGLASTLQAYLVCIANSHIRQRVDEVFNEKSLEEKKQILGL